jgi:hypothetical protein
MSPRPLAAGARRTKRRRVTLLWVAGLATLVIVLLYWEQIALLYVIATLGVTALLVVVALADIGDHRASAPLPAEDSAALGGGIPSTVASSEPSIWGADSSKRKNGRV